MYLYSKHKHETLYENYMANTAMQTAYGVLKLANVKNADKILKSYWDITHSEYNRQNKSSDTNITGKNILDKFKKDIESVKNARKEAQQ